MRKIQEFFIFHVIIFCFIFCFLGIEVKTSADVGPGGISVKILTSPQPTIKIDTKNLYKGEYVPVYLQGTVDNSATSWLNIPTIPQSGLSFIAEVYFDPNVISISQLKDGIDKAFVEVPEAFNMQLMQLPSEKVTIENTTGFKTVIDSTGKMKLRITLRGDSEQGLTHTIIKYYQAGLDVKRVENKINFAFRKDAILSKEGQSDDQSPGKVNTKGLIPPSRNNKIEGIGDFYDYTQCVGSWRYWPFIDLKSTAKPQICMPIVIPTWSEYISPWDFEEIYNTAGSSFPEVRGVTTELPGGYLTPTINWNLKKDGLPTEEMIAKRFGRVVKYFDRSVDKGKKVVAKATKTDSGEDFVLTSNDDGVLERPVTLKTKFKALPPSIDPHDFDKSYSKFQKIPFVFTSLSPTSKIVSLYEAVDDGSFSIVRSFDESRVNPQQRVIEKTELAPIVTEGQHILHFKLIDSNGLESEVKSLPITIDSRTLITKNTIIRQYNKWDSKNGILVVKNRNGHTVDFSEVIEKGKVDTSLVGEYPITYAYDGMLNHNKVTVLPTLRELNVKDITLIVGETLKPEEGFISAKDNDGNSVDFSKIKVKGIDKINTRKSGDYQLKYSLGETKPLEKKIIVHIMKGSLCFSTSSKINFPQLKIDGQSHIITPEEKTENLSIIDSRGINSSGWELRAHLEEVTSKWRQNHLDLFANFNKKCSEDTALEVHEGEFEFKEDEQIVCNVPTDSMNKEFQQSELIMMPKLKVPNKVTAGVNKSLIVWNLIEEPNGM